MQGCKILSDTSVSFKPVFVGDLVIFLGTCQLISVLSIVKHVKVSKILGTSWLTEILEGTMSDTLLRIFHEYENVFVFL